MRVVPLAPGVVRIPLMGDFINSFAFLDDDGQVTLVDCGTNRAPATIVAALQHLGKHPKDVTRIILTHAHSDHAGGAHELLSAAEVDGAAIHEADADFVRRGVSAPLNIAAWGGRMMTRLPGLRYSPFQVTTVLHDGDVLDVGGSLRIVHTPGHTPGHISLVHEPTGVLITGDALFNPFSRLRWPFSDACTSPEQNRQSARILGDLDYSLAAFTHGPEIRDRPRDAIRGFLAKQG